jgi:hypothetical protein
MSKTITIPAPISTNLAIVMWISGILCILGTPLVLLSALSMGSLSGLYCSLFLPVMIGVRLIGMPTSINNNRAALLKKREAAVAAGDSTLYVEKPSDPDVVRMSVLFGVLAVVNMPILFGPAAVIAGGVGLVQGHPKSLIGIGLGTGGLLVWGAVIYVLAFS